ncbi:MAG: hypothetical protein NDI69_14210 [Bacteriovoracaceae bacterium]|nr:hypothetical protein [Bacteriovoracaceae bacterium]
MKKFLFASLMLASVSAFSQSYLVLNNGVTLTTDKAGFIYDFGHFRIPYKVTISGGNFFVSDKVLSTVDNQGFLYEKDIKVDEINGKGLNYFIDDSEHLFTIDEQGIVYEYEEDSSIFRKVISYGGNFFTAKGEKKKIDLYTVSNTGNYFKMAVEGLNPAEIEKVGGKYFQTKSGLVYTVSKEGFVYPKNTMTTGQIKRIGGNFFIDSNHFIYTVSEDGVLKLPILPAELVVSDLIKLGSNYMIDSEGRIFVVDHLGDMYERTVAVKHDLRKSKIISK